MKDNFDLKKYLTENRLTPLSKHSKEHPDFINYKGAKYRRVGLVNENVEQPKKYYAVCNIQGEYGEPLTLTANTKEEMLDSLNTVYLELTGETRAPYSMEDLEDSFYNDEKLDHFISDDWASVTDNEEVFNRDVKNLKTA